MQFFVLSRISLFRLSVCTVATILSGCGTPSKLSSEQLAALGVSDGIMYWSAEGALMQKGYRCYVSGARRENFDCTKQTGFFPTCISRVDFEVDDKNLVSNLRALGPACIGTP
jgi:hypothetical protein